MGHQSKVCEVCEMPHESKTHHKNWSRRTLDPLLTLAASWLGHREQDKSHVCPLPTSHQDTSLELQMVLYRVLAGTKTKMHLSPWLKRPKNKNHNACSSAPGCYQKLHTRSYFSMLVMRPYHKTNQRRSLYLSGAGEGLSAGLEFLHARLHKLFFWSVMGQACLSLTLQSSDSQEPQNAWGLDFGHDSHTVCRGACGHVTQGLGWILLPQFGSPCTSLPCDWRCGREPASELNVICTGAADLLNSQVKSLRTWGARFHFIWGLAGVRPQDTVSSVWKRRCRSSAIHWFGSGGRETCGIVFSKLVIINTFCMVVVLAVQRFFRIWRTCETPINMPFFVSKNFPSKGISLTNFCKGEGKGWDDDLQLLLHGLLDGC